MFKISVISACFFQKKCYTGFVKRTEPLQGRVKFPIGGHSPRALRRGVWWNSKTDGTVRIKEGVLKQSVSFLAFHILHSFSIRHSFVLLTVLTHLKSDTRKHCLLLGVNFFRSANHSGTEEK